MSRIYYNFIKPHQAFQGKTPAEKVDINIDGKDEMEKIIIFENLIRSGKENNIIIKIGTKTKLIVNIN